MSMDSLLTRITVDPAICHGKPCVRGLRYPVEVLLELLSSGMTFEEVLGDYEDLEARRPACGPGRRGEAQPDQTTSANNAVRILIAACGVPDREPGWAVTDACVP